MSSVRPRDEEDAAHDRSPKRTKIDDESTNGQATEATPMVVEDTAAEKKQPESLLPPSHTLLGAPPPVYTEDGSMQRIMETDVGISEYIGHDVPKIEGIIKQRSDVLSLYVAMLTLWFLDSRTSLCMKSISIVTLYM